ncbi:MAG: DeoR/GlpR family DNA-binding transcription regulator [Lachnospiraceae bacterium]|nr:DeoR/GlpR family DNA-binding transcription regulator [Lachnospiraceae bacterium]
MMHSARREIIRDLLQSHPFLSLHDLEARFPDVSSMTLRRDIEYFEREGEAIKVRGGARSMKFITTSMEDAFNQRLKKNTNAKEKIAERAAAMIETGRSIFLDSGTTMQYLAERLPDERLTITTTGINIAMALMNKIHPIVNVVGGMLNRDSISVSGIQATQFLESINIDIAFIVPSGISGRTGLTSGNYIECELKRMIVEKARRVIVLMDSSKLDKALPYTFCSIDQIDTIITDDELSYDVMKKAQEHGVEVIIA